MTFMSNVSQPGLLFIFVAKKASLKSFFFKEYFGMEVVIF